MIDDASLDFKAVPVDRIVSVRFDEWPTLGAPLQLDLGTELTVLVGRNAAGKSLLLEALHVAAVALRQGSSTKISILGPGRMEFTMDLGGTRFVYEYSWEMSNVDDDEDRGGDEAITIDWREKCVRADSGELIWIVEDGVATLAGDTRMPVPRGSGLLVLSDNPEFPLPEPALKIQRIMSGVHLMRAGVPRDSHHREPMTLIRYKRERNLRTPTARRWSATRDRRVITALSHLLTWYEDRRDFFDLVVEIGRRLKIFEDIEVSITDISTTSKTHKEGTPTAEGEVLVDGTNFGCLSDGTLRVIELIVHLVDPRTTLLLLEELETAIHPALLRRILSELEARVDGQSILSTHSPAIVDWARPEDVRLIERTRDVTSARAMTDSEIQRLKAYLDDDLGVSDYIFSGAFE